MDSIYYNMKKTLILLLGGFFALSVYGQQVGLGTYYADKYHGRKTASGEIYDKYKFTAAHRTLDFGTRVRVTRLDNGRSVEVTVNDRGPFTEGRIIDVSRAAAEQLGLVRDGEVRVKVDVIGGSPGLTPGAQTSLTQRRDEQIIPSTGDFNIVDVSSLPVRDLNGNLVTETSPSNRVGTTSTTTTSIYPQTTTTTVAVESPAPDPLLIEAKKYTPKLFTMVAFKQEAVGYGVQIGAYFNYYRLLEAMDEIAHKGYQNTMVQNSLKNDKPVFRIIVGPFGSRAEANTAKKKLSGQRMKGIIVDLSTLN